MIDAVILVIFALASYMFGNVNWAIIISKSKNKDIRTMGSGNPGTLNMSRNLGLKFGLLTFFLDIMKGVVPTLVSFFVFKGKYFSNSKSAHGATACGFIFLSNILQFSSTSHWRAQDFPSKSRKGLLHRDLWYWPTWRLPARPYGR